MDNNLRLILQSGFSLLFGFILFLKPHLLYFLIAAYLLLFSILGFFFHLHFIFCLVTAISGILILLFPNLIPYLVAFHFIFFAILSFMAFGPSFFSIFPIIIAILLFIFPNSIAYLIASYLVISSIGNLLNLFFHQKGRFMI
ncbi:DUF3096 domain-containing protein [Methylacidiphilum caldifontis]|uniref:Uncharacterized protein n=1 Tax=Methylacidiphilum caldifontis TaxID=2795386 RepID=A0A4Y8PBX0_9BACT|nr:DUF3096 domain-containing protein [Methylacidiphilum caldifontis]TFE68636.1 hypothetical protein A7Q10_08330 [Methylacidiphilum caldifontis]